MRNLNGNAGGGRGPLRTGRSHKVDYDTGITRASIVNLEPIRWSKRANNAHANLWFLAFGENNFVNFFPLSVLFWRDVT